MADTNVASEELLEVPHCRAVLIPTAATATESSTADSPTGAVVVQFAEGTLRLLKLRSTSGPEASRVVLAIADPAAGASELSVLEDEAAGGFYYPLLAETPVCVAGGTCLTLPDPEGEDSFGLIFDAGGLEPVLAQLKALGCRTWQQGDPATVAALAKAGAQVGQEQHGQAAKFAGDAVQEAAAVATGAIKLASNALTWGIRQATANAKQSPLMEPTTQPVTVPDSAKKGVSAARETSKQVVYISGAAMDGVAKLAGAMAGRVASAVSSEKGGQVDGNSPGWMSDAKYVGGATVGASVAVFLALNEAADQIVQVSLGSTSELVGQKFGEEAGATSREGFHVAGNLMAAKSLVTKKSVAKALGKKTAVAAATSAASAFGDMPAPKPIEGVVLGTGVGANVQTPAPKPTGGIILGPKPP